VAGVLLGGAWSDALTRKGNLAAPLRVAIVGAMGMIVFACSYPLVGSAGVAVVILAIVNVFAALPWGAASAGVAAMLPADIRAQGTAAVFLVASLISGFLGPTAVAVLTDHVFHSGTGIRYGLAVLPAVMMPPAIWLLLRARDPYLRAVAASRRADDYEATRSAAGDSI
jgi:MFS family permease